MFMLFCHDSIEENCVLLEAHTHTTTVRQRTEQRDFSDHLTKVSGREMSRSMIFHSFP